MSARVIRWIVGGAALALVVAGASACDRGHRGGSGSSSADVGRGAASSAVQASSNVRIPVTEGTVGPVPGPGEPAPPANPLADDPRARQDGRQLFVAFNCSGCHGGHAGGGMGPSLRDEDWIYGSSASAIFSSISEGRANGMPAWNTRLPDDTMWRLTAYIQTLGTSDEAEPPR